MISSSIQIPNYYVNRGVSKMYPLTDAFVAVTGLTDLTAIAGLRGLEDGLRDNNLLDSMRVLYPFVADAATNAERLTQMSFNFLDTTKFQISWVGSPTASSVLSSNSGIDFNGTNQYGNLNFNILTEYGVSDLLSIGFYSGENTVVSTTDSDNGTSSGSTSFFVTAKRNASTFNHCNMSDSASSTISDRSGIGMFIGTRLNSTTIRSFRNKTLAFSSVSTNFLGNVNLNCFVGARNLNGSPSFYTNRRQQLMFLGNNLTDAQVETIVDINETYQTSLNRFLG